MSHMAATVVGVMRRMVGWQMCINKQTQPGGAWIAWVVVGRGLSRAVVVAMSATQNTVVLQDCT